MSRSILSFLLGIVSVCALAQEPDIYVHNGFLKGEDYLKASDLRQRAYVMGLVDGMFLTPLYGAPKTRVAPYETCLESMTDSQVAAILTKHLRDNPAKWHQSAHTSFFAAIREACGIK